MKAILALEDGRYFVGESLGAAGEVTGEVVFNTGMTGYQEVMTDPSYAGQLVTMTYPLVGNYGINKEDKESEKVQLNGFIVREDCKQPNNWKMEGRSEDYLAEHGIVAIQNIDTRALTKHIREEGMMQGIISTEEMNPDVLIKRAKESSMDEDLVHQVSTDEIYSLEPDSANYHMAVIDLGLKQSILDSLIEKNCQVTVFPADVSSDMVKAVKPDGVLLTNGPGDPRNIPEVVDMVKELVGNYPLAGICFGHQILGLALGAKTYKLKFGHHGSNQPVKDLSTGRVYITSQNHGYALKEDSLPSEVKVTHRNVNDGTVEGIKHQKLPIFSVQYHPEAAPGPKDSKYLFKKFVELIAKEAA